MRTIPDRLNLRAYCLDKAIDACKSGFSTSILDTAEAFEEYILGDIDIPDHAHYPDTFLTINNCPCDIIEEDDEGIGIN